MPPDNQMFQLSQQAFELNLGFQRTLRLCYKSVLNDAIFAPDISCAMRHVFSRYCIKFVRVDQFMKDAWNDLLPNCAQTTIVDQIIWPGYTS